MRRALGAAAALALAACATDSYHPYQAGEGYTEQRLGDAHWRVSFVGSTFDTQAGVEQRLLRRSAELTLENGYTWFAPSDQGVVEEESVVVTAARPRADAAEAVWRPRWRRRSGARWTDWDPQGASAPDRAPPTVSASELRYSATAEVAMGEGATPPGAFTAAAIRAQTQAPQ